MKVHLVSKAGWMAVLSMIMCAAAWAADGRDFIGLYEASDVTASGDDVTLTFSARLFNYSGGDVVGATVKLKSHVHPDEVYATFPAVDIANGHSVRLTQAVTLPSEEHDAWEQGAMPWLTIEFQDAAGNEHLSMVELAREVLAEEGE